MIGSAACLRPAGETARRRHYADFYGAVSCGRDRPLALVHGNCQAESLRLVLEGESLATVRIPAVHELTAEDLPQLTRWARCADVIVSQPIREGYRGLPIGTRDVLAAAGRARAVIVPVVRFAGLYPEHAIIRPPGDPGADPPLVPYHSLRVLAEAAGRPAARVAVLTAGAVQAVAAASLAELRQRERAHGTVVVSDLLNHPSFALMRTLNHPGNPLWLALAARTRAALGSREPVLDPGRPLLDTIHAPREAAVIETFGLDVTPDSGWYRDGRRIEAEQVREAHLRWYGEHPEAVTEGVRRHRPALSALGLR